MILSPISPDTGIAFNPSAASRSSDEKWLEIAQPGGRVALSIRESAEICLAIAHRLTYGNLQNLEVYVKRICGGKR